MNRERGYTACLLIALFCAASTLPPDPAFCADAASSVTVELIDLSGSSYFPAVRRELQNAKKSIVVTMYLIIVYPDSSPSSPPLLLVKDLVAARTRGVDVRVILGGAFVYNVSKGRMQSSRRNVAAAELLKAGGVEVRYIAGSITLHQKLIVIDGTTTIFGSHNWTVSALTRNLEVSALVRSRTHARHMLDTIDQLRLRPVDSTGTPADVIPVPRRFLTDDRLVPAMLGTHDHRTFDLFLLLWRQFFEEGAQSRSAMTTNLDVVAEELGMKAPNPDADGNSGTEEEMDRTSYRRQIIKSLKKLQDRYGLIECRIAHGGNASIRMAREGLKLPSARARLSTPPLPVPLEYWDNGWSRSLSHAAKVVYLICLAERQSSPTGLWWTNSQEWIARKYTNADCGFTIRNGLLELERHDILRISRDWPAPGEKFTGREPNIYRLKPLLSSEEIAERWNSLEKIYGSDLLESARQCAVMIDRPNSHETVASFLGAFSIYGAEETRKVARDVATLAKDNPFRHVGTVIYRLKKLKYPSRGQ